MPVVSDTVLSLVWLCSPLAQNQECKTELSDLKEKYETAEQEKQSMDDELQACRAEMKLLQEKGSKVRGG